MGSVDFFNPLNAAFAACVARHIMYQSPPVREGVCGSHIAPRRAEWYISYAALCSWYLFNRNFEYVCGE